MSTNDHPNNTIINRTTRAKNKRLIAEVNDKPAKQSVPKKSKVYKMSASEAADLKNLIIKLETNLCQRIESSQNILGNSINDLSNNVNSEVQSLKSSVDNFKSEISASITSFDTRLSAHEMRLDNNEDDINRLRYASDLRLNGISFTQNENLVQIFHTLSSIIGYDSVNNAIPLLERLPSRNKTTGIMISSPTILMHFSTIQHKQWFYSLYLSKMPVKAESFGLANGTSIILGENLTKKNASLFKTALNLRKEK